MCSRLDTDWPINPRYDVNPRNPRPSTVSHSFHKTGHHAGFNAVISSHARNNEALGVQSDLAVHFPFRSVVQLTDAIANSKIRSSPISNKQRHGGILKLRETVGAGYDVSDESCSVNMTRRRAVAYYTAADKNYNYYLRQPFVLNRFTKNIYLRQSLVIYCFSYQ